jgi:DNA polymerase (family 10)
VVPESSYGSALLYFTGSKAHNIAIRKIAVDKKLKINEYGLFQVKGKKEGKQIAGITEKEMYQKIGLSYIEPELRENRGEVEAAQKGKLPKLITLKDIRGDLHTHTNLTDGHNTLEEMAGAAKDLVYEYIANTEHSRHVTVAGGIDAKKLTQQIKKIDRLNKKLKGIVFLKSIEVDILDDGSLDLPNSILKDLDLVVCAIHYKFNLSGEKQTERIIRAMDNPYFNILAHPTGRLINEREPYELDMERIIKAAKQRNCVLELSAHPKRLDLTDIHCKMAKDLGVKVAISTDSHSTHDLDLMRYGIGQARRGWLEPKDVVNTRSLSELRKLLKRK